MTLGTDGQALLDCLCHCYGVLLNYLDSLKLAAQANNPTGTVQGLIKNGFDQATRAFGHSQLRRDSLNLDYLCSDYLRLVGNALGANPADNSALSGPFAEYREAVLATPTGHLEDLCASQRLAEELSRKFYSLYPVSNPAALARPVAQLEIEPQYGQSHFECLPHKDGGVSTITMYFDPRKFLFLDFLNHPFYCFHEYLSHIHSAPFLGDGTKAFEEGWLLLAEIDFFKEMSWSEPRLSHPEYRIHYVNEYWRRLPDDPDLMQWVEYGHDLADAFCSAVGRPTFRLVTIIVASTPHDAIPGFRGDVQGVFLTLATAWLQRLKLLSADEQRERINALKDLAFQPNPIATLFSLLLS